jgi:hypothetical protein
LPWIPINRYNPEQFSKHDTEMKSYCKLAEDAIWVFIPRTGKPRESCFQWLSSCDHIWGKVCSRLALIEVACPVSTHTPRGGWFKPARNYSKLWRYWTCEAKA